MSVNAVELVAFPPFRVVGVPVECVMIVAGAMMTFITFIEDGAVMWLW